ncbi:hypothetical protein FLJC2902T_25940 [Flavobacterium limnosediminis JC2902]|uniref:Uncharacterized protein n=1 Tax=Flavobacterium limnosediminis JC2902 TaxID=1341181 RepID=V6SQC2_9FLAO|nr:DUF6452 family protein [Flavobacterium limnosediminis]ESU26620.1 hypothetical protein FLJC2902T_25940 [Flavobacterium limnosediminis JC2902]
MKKLKIFALTVLIANSFWSCEKDDICAEGTPTTPSVVIEFYDAANPENLKNVTNLKILSPGYAEMENKNGVSKIKIPLKTNEDITTFQFILNGYDNDLTNDNTDELTFNYAREDIYVSRACGYKTVFQLNENNPVVTDGTNADGLWISTTTPIEVLQSNIQYDNETHIKIYF